MATGTARFPVTSVGHFPARPRQWGATSLALLPRRDSRDVNLLAANVELQWPPVWTGQAAHPGQALIGAQIAALRHREPAFPLCGLRQGLRASESLVIRELRFLEAQPAQHHVLDEGTLERRRVLVPQFIA